MPTATAKTRICSMLPSAKLAIGLAGIRFLTVSSRLVNFMACTSVSAMVMEMPWPTPSIMGRKSPRRLASRVVVQKYSKDWKPTLPVAEMLPMP